MSIVKTVWSPRNTFRDEYSSGTADAIVDPTGVALVDPLGVAIVSPQASSTSIAHTTWSKGTDFAPAGTWRNTRFEISLVSDFLITQNGNFRITQDGNFRIDQPVSSTFPNGTVWTEDESL